MNEIKKAVVVFSGGLDSTVTLYQAIADGNEVSAISFNYGQKHKKELDYASETCKLLGIQHEIVDLSCITKLVSNSSLTSDKEIPEGHYASENMKSTVVPNRNMIMSSIAIGWAVNIGAEKVYLGVHGGDHFIYPDCRAGFIKALNTCAFLANEGFGNIEIITPFLFSTKAEVVKQGSILNVPFENTWSCYKGTEEHCGKCGTCVERIEAFKLAEVKDPTKYQ